MHRRSEQKKQLEMTALKKKKIGIECEVIDPSRIVTDAIRQKEKKKRTQRKDAKTKEETIDPQLKRNRANNDNEP
jgi:hypothetical protein